MALNICNFIKLYGVFGSNDSIYGHATYANGATMKSNKSWITYQILCDEIVILKSVHRSTREFQPLMEKPKSLL